MKVILNITFFYMTKPRTILRVFNGIILEKNGRFKNVRKMKRKDEENFLIRAPFG